MIKKIEVKEGVKLKDYELYAVLSMAVQELKREASIIVPKLDGRTIWMINSTESGGGVAEMMPRLISVFRQLGLKAEWLVMSNDSSDFFKITKKIHNLIHGSGEPGFSQEETDHYVKTNEDNAEELKKLVGRNDIVIINDPQPMGMIKYLKEHLDVLAIWRCHIGLDTELPQTKSAWDFLKPFSEGYDHAVFSATEYVPDYFTSKFSIIYPSIDPLDHKNRDLAMHKQVGILCNADLIKEHQPVLTEPFNHQVKRMLPDGSFESPTKNEEIGLLFRPFITQVSRWGPIKGIQSFDGGL